MIITVLVCLSWFYSSAQAPVSKKMETALKKKIALACKLTDKDQIKRMNELHQTLFKKVSRAVEHKNSYELVFDQANDAMIGAQILLATLLLVVPVWRSNSRSNTPETNAKEIH